METKSTLMANDAIKYSAALSCLVDAVSNLCELKKQLDSCQTVNNIMEKHQKTGKDYSQRARNKLVKAYRTVAKKYGKISLKEGLDRLQLDYEVKKAIENAAFSKFKSATKEVFPDITDRIIHNFRKMLVQDDEEANAFRDFLKRAVSAQAIFPPDTLRCLFLDEEDIAVNNTLH